MGDGNGILGRGVRLEDCSDGGQRIRNSPQTQNPKTINPKQCQIGCCASLVKFPAELMNAASWRSSRYRRPNSAN